MEEVPHMMITSCLFEAYLKCPTKCWLRSQGELGDANSYAAWMQSQNETYRGEGIRRLTEGVPPSECITDPPFSDKLKSAKWRFGTGLLAQTQGLESRLHAVERLPSGARGKPAQFIPIRFVFANKLSKDDKLLLVFDALVLSEVLGREASLGRIIHGDDPASLKVKTSTLTNEARNHVEKMRALLSNSSPPDLVLNRHCTECEFGARCRQKAMEKDDLSLLANMTEKERKKYHGKGIFTVTQLSYTFRPRRRPRRLRNRREKYHHSLKALAIREKKIHIVGNLEFRIIGTPVYLDVEGVPDRATYYLIGLRVRDGGSILQHSLWADRAEDEGRIWQEFLGLLGTINEPVLVHYGHYERGFLRQMSERYEGTSRGSAVNGAIESSVNILSTIFGQVYFPTPSNSLKDIARSLGFIWSEPNASGSKSIAWRYEWEHSKEPELKRKLVAYNADDCQALELVAFTLGQFGTSSHQSNGDKAGTEVVPVDSLKSIETMWPRFKSSIPEFEQVNRAARWDYQRDHIYVRSSERIRKSIARNRARRRQVPRVARTIQCLEPECCPTCNQKPLRHLELKKRVLYDLRLERSRVSRRIVEYQYRVLWCPRCRLRLGVPNDFWPRSKYGCGLVAYLIYHIVELCIPMGTVEKSLDCLLGFNITSAAIHNLKRSAARYYEGAQQEILDRLVEGTVLHVDETRVSIKGKTAYVWVFTNLHEVAYLYADTREGEFMRTRLQDFRGVLISDFYSAYDSLPCAQQKCLIHLIRDLNTEILNQPYDEALRHLVRGFAELLMPMVETVDRYGLKKHFLQKHQRHVDRFYRSLSRTDCQSEAAIKCKQRFEKNRDRLFTFLKFDGVPWNNNNAEHAIKAFARLRDVLQGSCTAGAIREYLVLLSVCQTCEYMGVDFLDFLRSAKKDVYAFAGTHVGRRRQPARE
jgi:predicted RecB family nuclease